MGDLLMQTHLVCDSDPPLLAFTHDRWREDGKTHIWLIHNWADTSTAGANLCLALLGVVAPDIHVEAVDTLVYCPDGTETDVAHRLHNLDVGDSDLATYVREHMADLKILQTHAFEQSDAFMREWSAQMRETLGGAL